MTEIRTVAKKYHKNFNFDFVGTVIFFARLRNLAQHDFGMYGCEGNNTARP